GGALDPRDRRTRNRARVRLGCTLGYRRRGTRRRSVGDDLRFCAACKGQYPYRGEAKVTHGAPRSWLPALLPPANAAPHSYCSQWPVVPSAAPVGRVALAGRYARPVAEGARTARSAT